MSTREQELAAIKSRVDKGYGDDIIGQVLVDLTTLLRHVEESDQAISELIGVISVFADAYEYENNHAGLATFPDELVVFIAKDDEDNQHDIFFGDLRKAASAFARYKVQTSGVGQE